MVVNRQPNRRINSDPDTKAAAEAKELLDSEARREEASLDGYGRSRRGH